MNNICIKKGNRVVKTHWKDILEQYNDLKALLVLFIAVRPLTSRGGCCSIHHMLASWRPEAAHPAVFLKHEGLGFDLSDTEQSVWLVLLSFHFPQNSPSGWFRSAGRWRSGSTCGGFSVPRGLWAWRPPALQRSLRGWDLWYRFIPDIVFCTLRPVCGDYLQLDLHFHKKVFDKVQPINPEPSWLLPTHLHTHSCKHSF